MLIIGRNEITGVDMVKKLEATSSSHGHDHHGVRFVFSRRDLGSVKEIKATAEDITKWVSTTFFKHKVKFSRRQLLVFLIVLL